FDRLIAVRDSIPEAGQIRNTGTCFRKCCRLSCLVQQLSDSSGVGRRGTECFMKHSAEVTVICKPPTMTKVGDVLRFAVRTHQFLQTAIQACPANVVRDATKRRE